MSTLDNQNIFMDEFKKRTHASEVYTDAIWHALRDSDKNDPLNAAKKIAYRIVYGKREDDFKTDLQLLCDKHGIILKSGYNNDTDTAIYALFKECKKELHADDFLFVIDE